MEEPRGPDAIGDDDRNRGRDDDRNREWNDSWSAWDDNARGTQPQWSAWDDDRSRGWDGDSSRGWEGSWSGSDENARWRLSAALAAKATAVAAAPQTFYRRDEDTIALELDLAESAQDLGGATAVTAPPDTRWPPPDAPAVAAPPKTRWPPDDVELISVDGGFSWQRNQCRAAVAGDVPYYTLEDFRNYGQWFPEWSGTYKSHSIALKYFRDSAEENGQQEVIFPFKPTFVRVPKFTHEKGPGYSFDPTTPGEPWIWQEMVAQMDAASMEFVVTGEGDHRSRGLVSCRLVQFDQYDHKRAHKDPTTRPMPRIWNFVLTREDGSTVCLHPTYSSTKIELSNVTAVADHELPASGIGGTSARGTFQYFVQKHVARILRFDPQKKPGSRAVSSGHSGSQKHSGTRMIFEPQSQGQPAASSGSGTTR